MKKDILYELEDKIYEIYDLLEQIQELLKKEAPNLHEQAKRYWIAHIDTALLNQGGYLGGSFVSAADTLERLEMKIYNEEED